MWRKCDQAARVASFPVKAGWCICKTILNLLLSSLTVYIVFLIYFRPYAVRPHVDAAALARFDLVTPSPPLAANALRYDLAFNLSFFNHHHVFSICFDHLTAGLYYSGEKLGPADDTLPSFKQRPRRRTMVCSWLHGHETNMSEAVAEAFARESGKGRFNVDVRVKTTLTYRFWPTKSVYYYEYDCRLKFAPPANNGTPSLSDGTKCGKGRKAM